MGIRELVASSFRDSMGDNATGGTRATGGITCIVFVPAANGQPPCLLVNTSDSSATIIDCTYGPPAGVLTNLAVRQRVRVAHSLLPLKCCHSPSGQGYLISGSEDKEVYIYSLAKGSNYKMHYLKHHQVPVVAVAVNLQERQNSESRRNQKHKTADRGLTTYSPHCVKLSRVGGSRHQPASPLRQQVGPTTC